MKIVMQIMQYASSCPLLNLTMLSSEISVVYRHLSSAPCSLKIRQNVAKKYGIGLS